MNTRKLRIHLSLITAENDFQIAQAASAEEMARKLDVEIQVIYAGNDAVNQTTQIFRAVYSPPESRPDAVVHHPAGATALPQVARAAVAAGMGWAVLNRHASYVAELRKTAGPPVFAIISDLL